MRIKEILESLLLWGWSIFIGVLSWFLRVKRWFFLQLIKKMKFSPSSSGLFFHFH